MAGADQLMVPEIDVENAVSIESVITDLRKDIDSQCTVLLLRARAIHTAAHGGGAFRIRFWESRIRQIRSSEKETVSIHDLRALRKQCHATAQEMEEFAKGLL